MRARGWAIGTWLMLFAPCVVLASGSYAPPSRPLIATIDVERYHRGKQIFTGEAPSESAGSASDHQTRLAALQQKLPPQVQRSVDLQKFAGKLHDDQLDALEYYLSVRYKIGGVR